MDSASQSLSRARPPPSDVGQVQPSAGAPFWQPRDGFRSGPEPRSWRAALDRPLRARLALAALLVGDQPGRELLNKTNGPGLGEHDIF